jgi:hypothetical protein
MIHDPGEGAGVERLGHGVPVLARFLQLQRYLSHIPADVDLPHQSHLLAIFGINRGRSLHYGRSLYVADYLAKSVQEFNKIYNNLLTFMKECFP